MRVVCFEHVISPLRNFDVEAARRCITSCVFQQHSKTVRCILESKTHVPHIVFKLTAVPPGSGDCGGHYTEWVATSASVFREKNDILQAQPSLISQILICD